MSMVVRTNIMAVNANRQLGMNNSKVGSSLEKLASGFRINRAGDDASGLAISEKMKAQIKGLETASSNCQDGVSLIQTAEGALTEVHDMLNRMVELAGKAANGTMDDSVDRNALQKEVDALKSEINRIAEGTNFNGTKLLNGDLGTQFEIAGTDGDGVAAAKTELDFANTTAEKVYGARFTVDGKTFEFLKAGETVSDSSYVGITLADGDTGATIATAVNTAIGGAGLTNVTSGVAGSVVTITDSSAGALTNKAPSIASKPQGLTLQIGDTADKFNKISVGIEKMDCEGLGIDKIDISTQDNASKVLDKLRNLEGGGAINMVSSARADLGAMQNRLEHTINNLDVAAENMTSANSRIRDTDMAKQIMDYTKMNVLTQAAQAMLAQANQQPQSILQLLG